ncbi:MAG: hypothetical protein E7004_06025 [Alphaproteobacteria bacterium]|nr:hypothetical protein [Alphaproteobacteria bacterium]
MWFVFALITSLVNAFYFICSQFSKLKADLFIVYRGFIAALVTTPLIFVFPINFPWEFYGVILFQGFAISYMDYCYFKAFHKYGAENVNAITPLSVIITFSLWLLIDPNIVQVYLQTPYRSLLIVLSIIAIIFSVIKYQNKPIGLRCLKYVFPILFISSLTDISNKIIMNHANNHIIIASIYRVALTGWIIGIINTLGCIKKGYAIKEVFNTENFNKSLFIVLLILSMISLNLAMYYTPNPAYCSAIIYMSVIWIMVINQIRFIYGYKSIHQQIERKWIFSLLFAAIVLVLVTN